MAVAALQADIINVIVDVTFWTSLLFVPLISLRWPWWRHFYGRAAISIDVLLMLAFLPAELRRIFGLNAASAGFAWFEIAVLAIIPLRTMILAVAIMRIQRTGTDQPHSGALGDADLPVEMADVNSPVEPA